MAIPCPQIAQLAKSRPDAPSISARTSWGNWRHSRFAHAATPSLVEPSRPRGGRLDDERAANVERGLLADHPYVSFAMFTQTVDPQAVLGRLDDGQEPVL